VFSNKLFFLFSYILVLPVLVSDPKLFDHGRRLTNLITKAQNYHLKRKKEEEKRKKLEQNERILVTENLSI